MDEELPEKGSRYDDKLSDPIDDKNSEIPTDDVSTDQADGEPKDDQIVVPEDEKNRSSNQYCDSFKPNVGVTELVEQPEKSVGLCEECKGTRESNSNSTGDAVPENKSAENVSNLANFRDGDFQAWSTLDDIQSGSNSCCATLPNETLQPADHVSLSSRVASLNSFQSENASLSIEEAVSPTTSEQLSDDVTTVCVVSQLEAVVTSPVMMNNVTEIANESDKCAEILDGLIDSKIQDEDIANNPQWDAVTLSPMVEMFPGTAFANCCDDTVNQLQRDGPQNLCSTDSLCEGVANPAEVSASSKQDIADHSFLWSSEENVARVTKSDVCQVDLQIEMVLEICGDPETGCCGATRDGVVGAQSTSEELTSQGRSVLLEQDPSLLLPPPSVVPLCDLELASTEVEAKGEAPPNRMRGSEALVFGYGDKRRMSSRRLKRDPSTSIQFKQKATEVGLLVEEHLKEIFVPFESVEIQLVRQCRDILLCNYQGNFQKFKECFLIPAATLLRQLKSSHLELFGNEIDKSSTPLVSSGSSADNARSTTCSQCKGWPLCYNRRLVIQLGELDKALLKPGDFYFCVRESVPCGDCPLVYLCVRYRTKVKTASKEEGAREVKSSGGEGEVQELRIDEKNLGSLFTAMDWIESPGQNSLMSDEHLTSMLQHLLLSVERGIERLEWDGASKSWPVCCAPIQNRCCHGTTTAHMTDSSVQTGLEGEAPIMPEGTTMVTYDPSRFEPCLTQNDEPPERENVGQEYHPIHVNDTPETKQRHNEITKPLPNRHESPTTSSLDDESKLQLKCVSDAVAVMTSLTPDLIANDDEADDGYYEHTITQPSTVSEVLDLLQSKIAILPGSRDRFGRSVVLLSSFAAKESSSVSAYQLAQLLLYFYTIPKKEVVSKGFLFLIDAEESTAEFWNFVDEAFCLLEANVSNVIGQILVFAPTNGHNEILKIFKTSRVQFEIIKTKEKLQNFIRKDQLLPTHGGTYVYDHQEWISFRKFLEPFINGCRLSGRHLVALLEELRGSRLPPSSALTLQMIEQQKKSVRQTFQDEQFRHLEEEGDTVLKELESYRTRSPQNFDYRENLERTNMLYEDLRKAMCKLSKLADKRLQRLEECLQMRTFQEESSQVLSWLCKKGMESLEKHQAIADHLGGIKEQEEEFEKFYFLAMRQIERGNDLLEEASMHVHEVPLPKIKEECQIAEDEGGMRELATTLRQRLGSFSEQLEFTRERIEDTAKCYQMMDKSYEWALDAMRFVSQLGLPNVGSPEVIARQIRCLQDYLDDHLPISDDAFLEIIDLASRSGSVKLLDQCNIAKQKCQETVDLIQTRMLALMKVKQQMEVDSFRVPLFDSDDSVPTPRTTRSHSQPTNMWNPAFMQSAYPMSLSHFRRRSESSAISCVPQSFGSLSGSYTSFPSSYYPILRDSLEKDEQILQRGLITEDLTNKGPVACISRDLLDSRISHKEGPPSLSSSSSSSCGNSCKGIATSVLRSSGRGMYVDYLNNSIGIRWPKKHTRKSQTWHLKDEALEKIKNEVREQNALFHVDQLHLPQDIYSGSIHSNFETDSHQSLDSCCKTPVSQLRSEAVRGPIPVNTHLLTSSSNDSPGTSVLTTDVVPCDVEAKAKKTLMLIMKEMIHTERDYVKSLEYIIDNYIPELLREDIPQALRGQRNVVFGNIEKINEFHSLYFLNELEQCEHTPFTVGQCFLKYESQFYLYALYNKNKPKSDSLIIEYGNLFFRKKQLELEDKMDLASYLLKPVQRMGKYALLLKQLLKECPEIEPEHQDLKAAEEMVRFQLRHGNDLLAMDALRDCDVNVKEQGKLLRQDEFLVWQGRSRKSLRHVFLFEDLILFSKARRDPQRKGYEMYQYKQSIKTTDMGMTEQIGDSPTKFEIWFRKRKLNDTYVLQAFSPDIKAAWVHEVSKLLWKQALRNREMRLAEMSSMGIGNKPCLDIKPSEDQINDRSISFHQLTRAPRFRNSVGMPPYDVKNNNKRPHSIISVSSSSSSGSSQSSFTFYGTLNLGFEPGDSPRPLHRSLTQQSQCSTESGFCTDASTAGDSPVDCEKPCHKKAERSDSLLSSDSSSTTPSEVNCSPCEDSAIDEVISTSM